MNNAIQAGIAIGSVAILVGLMVLVRRQAKSLGLSAEVQRKTVHIGAGLYALALPWLFTDRWPVFMLLGITVVVMLVLRLPKLSSSGIGATLHSVERRSYGDLLLVLAIGTVFLLSNGKPILYVLPLVIVALSDAAAALTGSTYGSRFFKVEDNTKSVEGSVAFFITSFCLAMICLLLLSDTPRVNVVYLAAIVAAFGTLVEADSWSGFDNFFLPAGLCVFLEAHLETPPLILFTIMAVFLISIAASIVAAKRLNMTNHTARVYVIAVFLLFSVLDFEHAMLPLMVFLAHAICNYFNRSESDHPELDVVSAIALISFFWLALGRTNNTFNIPLYGLTTLSMTLGFCALYVTRALDRTRLIACLSIGIVSTLFYFWFYWVPEDARAVEVTVPILIVTCLFSFMVPLLSPDIFKSYRVFKVTCLAMMSPLLIYAIHMYWLE